MSNINHNDFDKVDVTEVTLPSWEVTFQDMITNGVEMTTLNSFEVQNNLALAASSDNEVMTTAHTAIHKNDKSRDTLSRDARVLRQASESNAANISFDISRLDLTSSIVSIAHNGILQIGGRDATLDEKMVLEENSQACSVGVTQTELDIEEFLAGRTNEVPEALQQMAEERGITNPSMEDYQNMVREEFPVHISSRMIGGGINFTNSQSLLPPLAADFSSVSADGPMSAPTEPLFSTQASALQSTPIIAPAP